MSNSSRAPDDPPSVIRDPRLVDPHRRRFLRTAALSIAGGGALAAGCDYTTQLFLLKEAPTEADKPSPTWQESRVRSYRVLGRTGTEMSDISFGCSGLDNVAVVKRALERGITSFDTSTDYSRAGSERVLGEGIKGHPRDKLFLVSKFCTPEGHLGNDIVLPAGMWRLLAGLSIRCPDRRCVTLRHVLRKLWAATGGHGSIRPRSGNTPGLAMRGLQGTLSAGVSVRDSY